MSGSDSNSLVVAKFVCKISIDSESSGGKKVRVELYPFVPQTHYEFFRIFKEQMGSRAGQSAAALSRPITTTQMIRWIC